MPADPVRVALIQMACAPSTGENLDHAADLVRQAARDGAQLICLPELFRSQYFCQREDHALFALAEPIPGPSTARLSAVVREAKITLIASLFERRAPGLYHNTVAVLDHESAEPGQIAGIYRKMHIPDDPLYYEKFYFAPGDLGFRAIPTSHGPIGSLICWDQWFPEAARLTALAGAQSIFYPTAIGWHPSEKSEFGAAQYSAWKTIQRAHAIANGVFVCAVNRVGHEHGDVILDSPKVLNKSNALKESDALKEKAALGESSVLKGTGFSPRGNLDPWPRRPHLSQRHRVLGRQLHRRSLRPHPRPGQPQPGRDCDRDARPRAGRNHPPALALPARPPHRRLRRHHQPPAGLILITSGETLRTPPPETIPASFDQQQQVSFQGSC
jgi:N-carbamoylputrescine amidase